MKSDCDWLVIDASTKLGPMNRRQLLATLAATGMLPRQATSATQWQYRILKGGFDGKIHRLGLELSLAKGWKTYWRVPGDGGVPPTITVIGDNIASVNVLLPTPTRYRDQSGESIGYKDSVVFAIDIAPTDPARPVAGKLEGFLGVCEQVCIPVQLSEPLTLTSDDPVRDATILSEWRNKLPQVSADPFPVSAASATQDPLGLLVTIAAPVDDIFVEPLDGLPLYFRQPQFSASRADAVIQVAGTKSIADISNRQMRFTSVTKTLALEQVITTV
jgi:DsbC/DsbD-like thiol-disulfide interchange protein